MRLPGGLASEGCLTIPSTGFSGLTCRIALDLFAESAHGLCTASPGVHRAAVINKLAHIGPDPR